MSRQLPRLANEQPTEIAHRPFWVRLRTITITVLDDVPEWIQYLTLFLVVYFVASILRGF
jgi:hypothetical protein